MILLRSKTFYNRKMADIAPEGIALTNFEKFEIMGIVTAGGVILGTALFVAYGMQDFLKNPGQSIGKFVAAVIKGTGGAVVELVKELLEPIFGWMKPASPKPAQKSYTVGK